MIKQLANRIQSLLGRAVVLAASSAGKMQQLQIRILAGEDKSDVEHFEPYGFTSCPKPGAEALPIFFDGDRSHGVVIVVADRRYRLQALQAGEMAIHDDQGQKVHLTRDGIVIDGAGLPMVVQNVPLTTWSGDLHVLGTVTGDVDVIAAGKSGKTHTHLEHDVHGQSDPPT